MNIVSLDALMKCVAEDKLSLFLDSRRVEQGSVL